MKNNLRYVIAICFFLFTKIISAQTVVFHEDFEVVDSMTSSGNPTWFQQGGYYTSPTNCIRDTVLSGNSAYLSTIAFSTAGNYSVLLNFSHICKIANVNLGTVEVSNNNGSTWTVLTAAQYLGSSGFNFTNRFSSGSYGALWAPGIGQDTITPTQSWWKQESFDISSLVSNSPQVMVRFKLTGGTNNRNYGWLIDDVNVVASFSELTPPRIAWSPPIIQNTVYSLGPFTISDTITDASGIAFAGVYYSINGNPPLISVMTNASGNIWRGIIPAVNNGDSVCYFVEAFDASPDGNTAQLPASGCISFVASSGIALPYSDNFDALSSIWTDSSTGGSSWQLGTPNYGVTNSPHSFPNAWDINLSTPYTNGARCFLTSPAFDFTGIVNAHLSFWRNHLTETGWDGARLEYSTNNGGTWHVLGFVGDPLSSNWYTIANAGGPLDTMWDGNSLGWVKSTYSLGQFTGSQVKFRFVFMSDNSGIQDGFSIDDFSISIPPPLDVGVTSIVQPGIAVPAGIPDTIKVVVENFGSQPVSGFNTSYIVNGGLPFSQIYSDTLLPGRIDTVAFLSPFTFPAGAFNICAYTTLAGDGDFTNDMICKNSQGLPVLSLPYTDNFEVTPFYWHDSSAFGTSWQLGLPNFGQTNSTHSGSYAWDINLTTAYGYNARSVLTSPLFNFTNQSNARLSFWMNRNIAFADGVFLEYSTDVGSTWHRLGTLNDLSALDQNWYNNSNIDATNLPGWDGSSAGWKRYLYTLGPPFNNAGPHVMFRFIFTSDPSVFLDGVTIDDISILPASSIDIGILSINEPVVSSIAGTIDTVEVTFRNFGSTTITNTDLGFRLNGSTIAVESWSGSLLPADSTSFTFTTPFTVPVGQYDICAFTSHVADADRLDDTLCQSYYGQLIFSIPYIDNFDSINMYWHDQSSGTGTNWQHGFPAFGQTTGAYSLSSCWDINLTSSYQNNALSYLYSPLFDFTGLTDAGLSFMQNRNTENGWDGMRLEYSTDEGTTWTILGIYGDPNAVNWYNKASIASSGLPAWDSISIGIGGIPGWQKSSYLHLPSTLMGAFVWFRFVFTSDGSVVRDGISIDNFRIDFIPEAVTSPLNTIDDLEIFPNPSPGIFYLKSDLCKACDLKIKVKDILGHELKNYFPSESGINYIDLSSEPNGIYFVTIISETKIVNRKIILSK